MEQARIIAGMDKHLEQYLALCQRIYERMEREGSWPFLEPEDSTKQSDVIDSPNNPQTL